MEHLEALGQPSRLRDRIFADAAKELGEQLARIGRIGSPETPEAIALAWKIFLQVYSPRDRRRGVVSDKKVLNKVRAKLAQADILRAIREVYALRGFNEVEAIDMHIGHIRGIDGQPPNYAALKDYQKMTMPQEARRVQIDKRSVNVIVSGDEPMRVGPPPTRARQLPGVTTDAMPKSGKKENANVPES